MDDKLFINLRILSKIQKNGKITRSSDGIIALENENFYQFLKRFVTSDSRKQSVFEINSIINETIRALNNIVDSKFMNKLYSSSNEFYKGCENLNLILKELRLAKIGIDNLQFTYKSYVNITSQLDILIIKIQSAITDMTHKLKYFHSFLPESYKLDIDNNYEPHYYTNTNTNDLQMTQPSLSSSPPQLLKSKYETDKINDINDIDDGPEWGSVEYQNLHENDEDDDLI